MWFPSISILLSFILNNEGMFKFIKDLQRITKMTGIFSAHLETVGVANYIS